MVSFDEIIDKANVKELIAIVLGMVGSRVIDGLAANVDSRTRDIAKFVGGEVATYFLNDMAEKNPDKAELLGLAGLVTTTIAATPIANRLSVTVAKYTGTPIKIVASKNPEPAVVENRPANAKASIVSV